MKRMLRTFVTVAALLLCAAMVVRPHAAVYAARDAVLLCLNVVVPSLFPFLICSQIFIRGGAADLLGRWLSGLMRPLFGVPGGGALAVVLGIVSGYPVGAACIAALYQNGSCTKAEAERLLAFCNNSGPLFILGAVGVGMLESERLGVLLYTVHLLAALLTGLLFRNLGSGKCPAAAVPQLPPPNGARRGADVLSEVAAAVTDAVRSIAKICGFVILFATVAAALPGGGITPFVYGLLEITGGIRAIIASGAVPGALLLAVVSFFLALSGVSVLLQTAAIVLPAGLSLRTYLLGKVTQATIAFLLAYAAVRVVPGAAPVFAPVPIPAAAAAQLATPRQLLAAAFLAVLFSLAAILVLVLIAAVQQWWQKKRQAKYKS